MGVRIPLAAPPQNPPYFRFRKTKRLPEAVQTYSNLASTSWHASLADFDFRDVLVVLEVDEVFVDQRALQALLAEHVFDVQDVLGLVVLYRTFEVSERPLHESKSAVARKIGQYNLIKNGTTIQILTHEIF